MDLANHFLYETSTIDYDLADKICSNIVIHICSNLVNCIFWSNEQISYMSCAY